MKREVAKSDAQIAPFCDGVFTRATASFLVTDDLQILPNAGLLQIVSVLGVADLDEAETINVTFGLFDVLELLEASLICTNPLSVVILHEGGEYEEQSPSPAANASISNSKTMNLKLMVQKSTNKLLYAEAEEDFVEFLFSFLVIPLGRVVSLLSRNSNLKPIDSLYKSADDLIHHKYFINFDAKNRLIQPNIPHGYISNDHIFPLTEESLPDAYSSSYSWFPSAMLPKRKVSYLIGPRTYKVSDDLTVTPFCIVSILSSLNKQKIAVTDVEEVELQIGLKEALSILKASLTSTTALSDALLSRTLNRKPKKEV
ncbi:uncharacterized protein LOC131009996 [Salvia miltiorrhiza]|uniref:uncharacterized protein LOC131009996 n=1 Tax=Salvia miltiorrhiza TaxID=226208 RepID=UPI0025AD36F3|nr:uncharacterized protein LOC131009996 [Salvia miltiorrhiza]